MDAFSLIIILALGACVLMHLFGHGHGRSDDSQEEEHHSHAARHRRRDDPLT